MVRLTSWASLPDPQAQRFAGTALYRLTFDAPGLAEYWWLDLGKVCQSARVRMNGRDLGTLFTSPFRVLLTALKAKGNVLEVEVTNVAANRIRDLDRRSVAWKTFHDINFVGIDYKPFDASNWPLRDSGLLGPVTLTPVKAAPTLIAEIGHFPFRPQLLILAGLNRHSVRFDRHYFRDPVNLRHYELVGAVFCSSLRWRLEAVLPRPSRPESALMPGTRVLPPAC